MIKFRACTWHTRHHAPYKSNTHCMVVVLPFLCAVTIAGVQSEPLIIGGQGTVGCSQRVVEHSPRGEESCSSHQSCREGSGLSWRGWSSEVLIADACQ